MTHTSYNQPAPLARRISNSASKFGLLLIALLLLNACDLMGSSDPTPLPQVATVASPTPGIIPNVPTQADIPTIISSAPTQPPLPTEPPLPTATVAPTPTTPPSVPKGGTLTLRLTRDVTTLNPFFVQKSATDIDQAASTVTGLIFSGLTRIDNQLRPQPDLAESWTVAPDGLSIDFHLRAGVKWQDGQPLTVADVLWTYDTLLSLPYPTPVQYQLRDAVLQIYTVDNQPNVVRFALKKPFAPLLSFLNFPVLPKHLLDGLTNDQLATSSFSFQPVGTGPFKYESHVAGENVVLVANPDYYGGAPNISRIAFLIAPDENVAADALGSGALSLGEVSQTVWQNWSATPPAATLTLGKYADLGYTYVAFNLRAGNAFADRRLRQAWAYALNKQAIVADATKGEGLPVWTDVAPSSWAYAADAPHLDNDPAKAKQLLDDAGWKDNDGDGIRDQNGSPLEVTMFVRADDDQRRKIIDDMVPPLAAVGIRVIPAPVDFASVLKAKLDPTLQNAFDWHTLLLGWDSSSLDPDSFALFHSSQITSAANPQGLNYPGFASAEYDSLSFNARNTFDFGARATMYSRMQQIIAQELPYYFLWSDQHFLALNSNVQGPIDLSSPRFLWNVEKWWIVQ